jgi:predicted small metal-binding protein
MSYKEDDFETSLVDHLKEKHGLSTYSKLGLRK